MFNYDREYAEFKDIVKDGYTSNEEKRIQEELALFEQRGWQKYIVLLPKILRIFEDIVCHSDSYSLCDKSGTFYDSYTLLKYIGEGFDHHDFLREHKNKKDLLFKNPLSLTFHLKPSHEDFNFDYIDRCMNRIISDSELYCTQRTLKNVGTSQPDAPTLQKDLYIFSTSPIPISDIDQIQNKNRYLLIKFTTAPMEKTPYEELKSKALAACTSQEEIIGVRNEFAFTENHGWQKCLVLIARMLGNLDADDLDLRSSDICLPWYFLLEKILGDRFSKFVNFIRHYNGFYFKFIIDEERSKHIEKIIDNSRQGLGLHKKELIIRDEQRQSELVLEKKIILLKASCFRNSELFAKEYEECTPEEKERLNEYLIFDIHVHREA